MICETCGAELRVAMWPFCPHGMPSGAVIDDALDGGPRFFEHLDHQPVWVETKTQLQQELDKRGLRLTDHWAGPSDKHLTNWAAGIDAKTLDDKRVLLSRGSRQADESIRCETFQGSVRELKAVSDRS